MALYVGDGPYRENPNIRFYADIVYTNTCLPRIRGYAFHKVLAGGPAHGDIAREMGFDPIGFRLTNALRSARCSRSAGWSEGREPQTGTFIPSAGRMCGTGPDGDRLG